MKARIFLFLYCFAVGLLIIAGMELNRPDEPRVGGIAREMTITNDYDVAWLNGKPFLEYPSFGHIPTAFLMSFTPIGNDFFAHLSTMLFGFGTVVLTYLLGRQLAGERIGLLAAFFLQTTVGFLGIQKRLTVDCVLLFFITLSLFGFYNAFHRSKNHWLYSCLFYLGMTAATLTKGLIGLGLPLVIATAYFFLKKDWRAWRRLHPFSGFFLFLLLIALWMFAVYVTDGWEIVVEIFRQSVYRFAQPDADHSHPAHYYLAVIAPLTLPWCIFFIILFWLRFSKTKWTEAFRWGEAAGFPLVWFVLTLAVLSLASAKRNLYLGPLYPAFAILTALAWSRLNERWHVSARKESFAAIGIFIVFAIVHFSYLRPNENQDSYRPFFDEVKKSGPGLPVYMMWPSESLRGAGVYYLGKRVPVIESEEELNTIARSPGEKFVVLFLTRDKKNPIEKIQGQNFPELVKEAQRNDITYLYKLPGG